MRNMAVSRFHIDNDTGTNGAAELVGLLAADIRGLAGNYRDPVTECPGGVRIFGNSNPQAACYRFETDYFDLIVGQINTGSPAAETVIATMKALGESFKRLPELYQRGTSRVEPTGDEPVQPPEAWAEYGRTLERMETTVNELGCFMLENDVWRHEDNPGRLCFIYD